MPMPDWWPQVVQTTTAMRRFTRILLDRATPSLDDGVLRLRFDQPGVAAAWQASGAQAALEAALKHHGYDMRVEPTA